jgi:hypothetical protein
MSVGPRVRECSLGRLRRRAGHARSRNSVTFERASVNGTCFSVATPDGTDPFPSSMALPSHTDNEIGDRVRSTVQLPQSDAVDLTVVSVLGDFVD